LAPGVTSSQAGSTLLKTPTAQLAVNGGSQHPDKRKEGGHGPTLADEIEHRLMPTPRASDGLAGPDPLSRKENMDDIATAVKRHLTPDVELLPTPIARDWRSGKSSEDTHGKNARPLNEVIQRELTPDEVRHLVLDVPAEDGGLFAALPQEYVLLPTPVAQEGWKGTTTQNLEQKAATGQVFLTNAARTILENGPLLPTPVCPAPHDSVDGAGKLRERRPGYGVELTTTFDPTTGLLPTPKASDGDKGGPNQRGSSGDYALPAVANLLPTPSAGVFNDGEDPEQWQARQDAMVADGGKGFGMPLSVATALLPTPTVGNATGGNASRSGDRSDEKLLPGLVTEHQTNWGAFEPAIRRWEAVMGRPAPAPTEPTGKNGAHRLASRFVEWMMGLVDGHVTGVGLKRNAELKALGNGVVPQQGEHAINVLLSRQWLYTKVDRV
jgi:hypothetical protein